MAHRKLKEMKQQPSLLPGPAVPGCCLIYLHFLWAILPIRPVLCFERGDIFQPLIKQLPDAVPQTESQLPHPPPAAARDDREEWDARRLRKLLRKQRPWPFSSSSSLALFHVVVAVAVAADVVVVVVVSPAADVVAAAADVVPAAVEDAAFPLDADRQG